MRGIVLAAGRGSRLRQLTDDRPKCLVELGGKPLLHWQLDAMRAAGVERVLVVRGYLAEKIKGDFDVCDNPRWNETHMVASLLCAREWLEKSPCIVSYADIVYDDNAVAALMNTEDSLAVLYDPHWAELWEKRFDDPLSDAESFSIGEDGLIKDIGRKGVQRSEIQGQYMGLLKFTPESIGWIDELLNEDQGLCDRLDMTSLLARLIQRGKPVSGVPCSGAWCEVDSEQDLAVAEAMAAAGHLVGGA